MTQLRLLQRWLREGPRVLFSEGPVAFADAALWALRDALGRPQGEAPRAATTPIESRPAAAPMPMAAWHLESPDITRAPADASEFAVSGWIAAAAPATGVRFADDDIARLLPIALGERDDVRMHYGLPALGFAASCAYERVSQHEVITLLFEVEGREFEIVVPVYRPPNDAVRSRREKLERLASRLRCPNCGSSSFLHGAGVLRCRRCRTLFPRSEERLDFLTPELRERFAIVPTQNVSANVYDGEALNIIHRMRHGLVLDCGAGLRDRYYPNVVNYEIAPYPTTDVLGVGERLPFRDGAFDAVFSFAVLEHVKDPFACSREILRVLKPDGILYCQVPFLQPVHGYPHHYYNMTRTGMESLFGDAIRIERSGPFLFGQPVFALSWILNRYAEGLPTEQRAAFEAMRVEELLRPASAYLGAPFVTELRPTTREEISCCNALIATKVR